MFRNFIQHLFSATLLALSLCIAVAQATAYAAQSYAAENNRAGFTDLEAELPSAPVMVDGNVLFRVRGTIAFPAEKRAAAIAERIEEFAADLSVPADAVHRVDVENGTTIIGGNHPLMIVYKADASLESVNRSVLADAIVRRIRDAVAAHRQARTRESLTKDAVFAALATALVAAVITLILWVSSRLEAALERRYRGRLREMPIQALQLVQPENLWHAAHTALNAARVILIILIGFIYLHFVLGLFPWTRGGANRLLEYVLTPVGKIALTVINEIPNLIFLAILFFVTRYVLKLIYLFFGAVGRGDIKLAGFAQEWADPTYKLLRAGIVVFVVIAAYPYFPGSNSEAFKAISIFIGLVLSLGSSSAIANMIAGYSIAYRRAFRVGDRVKIGTTVGDVTERRLQATYVKTVKNEEVIVPNSAIVNNEVVNYSSLAREGGLILHTDVGIGYETPWRQVEAMLLMAAERTPGVMKEPKPFVLQQALGDFAVTYEINVYCDNAQMMNQVYTDLHRSILDVFNEFEVQIMTPAYRGDPDKPKLVPKDQWFMAPAIVAGYASTDGDHPVKNPNEQTTAR